MLNNFACRIDLDAFLLKDCSGFAADVAADARLDYIGDLRSKLFQAGLDTYEEYKSDVELISLSYQHWGRACLQHLEGDYAFLIYDGEMDRDKPCPYLFGARSISGLRSLYYAQVGRVVYFANSIKTLFDNPSIPKDLNPAWLHHWLLTGHDSPNMTPFISVKKVPPGHSLLVNGEGVVVKPFWSIEPLYVHYKNQQECSTAFAWQLFFAIQQRLPFSRFGNLLVDISGGLDSSSLACVAAMLLKDRAFEVPELHGIHAYSEQFAEKDDRTLARRVADKYNLSLHTISYEQCGMPFSDLSPRSWSDSPAPPTQFFRSYYNHLFAYASSCGASVHMRGDFGDQLFDIVPALPSRINLRGRAPWLRSFPEIEEPPYSHVANAQQRAIYESLQYHEDYVGMQSDGVRRAGLETVEPFTDTRLINFICSVPPEYQLNAELSKFLLRDGLVGVLPEEIRTRTGKGRMSRVMFAGLCQNHAALRSLIVSMPSALREYIDADALAETLDTAVVRGVIKDQILFFAALSLVLWSHNLEWLK